MIKLPIYAISFVLMVLTGACKEKEGQDLQIIPIDIFNENTLELSQILDDVTKIELELTNESLVDKRVKRVVWSDKYILVLDISKIMLFDREGSFIRTIGQRGQGSEEYIRVVDFAVDFENELVFVADLSRLICYDFNGHYINDQTNNALKSVSYLNFISDGLLFLSEHTIKTEDDGKMFSSVLYWTDGKEEINDSIQIHSIINPRMKWTKPWADYVTKSGKETFLYYPEFNAEPSLRDTLFALKDKKLMPYLRLDFSHSGLNSDGKRLIFLFNIWKSKRFVFSVTGLSSENEYYRFCFDQEAQIGYNMKDGFLDDIHTGERVDLRPLNSCTEEVYYLHTFYDKGDGEEPNPTLYLGKLKE